MGIRGIEALTENECDHDWLTNDEGTFRRCLSCDAAEQWEVIGLRDGWVPLS